MRTISFSNNKGGVGKTTSVLNVGAGLARAGKRVLLIDLDPQANLSQGLGIPSSDRSIYESISGKCHLSPVEVSENLFLVPSSYQLKNIESEFITRIGGQVRLRKLLSEVDGFDVCLIDCPPSLGLLTTNSFSCSDDVIIPLTPQFFSVQGIVQLNGTIDEVRENLNPKLKLSGIILTLYNRQKIVHRDIATSIEESFGDLLFKTRIRSSVAIEEAPHQGLDVFRYAPTSIGAKDYQSLVDEFLLRFPM